MARYLSTEWLEDPTDPLAEAFARSGDADLRIGRVVTKAPDGEVRFTSTVADGTVRYEVGTVEDAEITLTDTYASAVEMVRGALDPNAPFVRGQTKVTGPTGPLLSVLAAARTDAYAEARRSVLEASEL